MASPPYVNVWLSVNGAPSVDITSYLTQETGSTLTTTIENPTQLGSFTAPEVTLKGYDPTGYVQGLLAGMTPLSTGYILGMTLGVWDPTTLTLGRDIQQILYIVPNTLQFDTVTKSFQFTAAGTAHFLATTSAQNIAALKRAGYFDGKWTLQQDASPLDNYLRVTTAYGTTPCDFQSGDQIKIGGNESFTVSGVQSDGANPPVYWTILLNGPLQNKYAAASTVPVNLLTPYIRNVDLHTLVGILFGAAGLSPENYYKSAPLPLLTQPFASPVSVAGLPGGAVTGISPSPIGIPAPLAASTPGEVYQATGPTSGFTPLAPRVDPVIDPTNTGTTYVYTGQRRLRTRSGNPRFGLNVTMKFYAYDAIQYGATQNRYTLAVTCNADVAPGTPFTFSTSLSWETYNLGSDTWTVQGTLGGATIASSTTSTDLSEFWNALGVAVDPATGTCFFTDLDVSVAGGAIGCNVSTWQPTGATIATGTLTRNRATGINGPIVALAPSTLGVFQTDGLLGNAPRALIYTVTGPGVMTLAATQPCSAYLVGQSVKKNAGDGGYYGLISDPVSGVQLVRLLNVFLAPDTSVAPVVLSAPPASPSARTTENPYDVDLCVTPTAGGPGSGAYPIYVLIAGTIYYVSTTGSGVVPYADPTGLSVGDMLSQLTLLTAGIFYMNLGFTGWVFRSRSAPDPTMAIYSGVANAEQLDQSMTVGGIIYPSPIMSLVTQSVYHLWAGYVSITNENNSAIFGSAGDPTYASANSGNTADPVGNAIELQCRFVATSAFATALAQSLYAYLGAQKRTVTIEAQRDGLRIYDVGRTFHTVVDGINRQFQIIQSQTALFGSTTTITALEV